MPYIKKIHLHGFKSFAKPTDIILDKGLNVIVGPNGSGKSNIVDAICFVLGRMKIKSMRAERSAKLIYDGGKEGKPATNAKVSMVFDNSDGVFALPSHEVEITRIVKRDGTSTYKINGETKTRQEMLELLAQGDIDPEGFNIILQAEINNFVQMRSEEKRQIIEEVAGISIYEERKEKSIKELEKTEEKLKEIKTVLNERAAYLRNLESERAHALKYQNLKKSVEIEKASLLWQKIKDKKKNLEKIDEAIEEKTKIIEKLKQKELEFKEKILEASDKIKKIEQEIQTETGVEQEKLRRHILELKTELASLNVKKENTNDKINSLEKRSEQLKEQLKSFYLELNELEKQARGYDKSEIKKESALIEELNKAIKETKQKLDEIEAEKDKYNFSKMEISKKEFELNENNEKLIVLRKKISEIKERIAALLKESPKINIDEIRNKKNECEKKSDELKKEIHILEKEIFGLLTKKEISEKDISELLELNRCPKCKQLITKDYKDKLAKELKEIVDLLEKDITVRNKNKAKIEKEINKLTEQIASFVEHEKQYERLMSITQEIKIKELELESLRKDEDLLISKISKLREEITELKEDLKDPESIEEIYSKEKIKLENLQENLMKIKLNRPVSEERNFDVEITLKKQDIEKSDLIIKRSRQEKLELEAELKELIKKIVAKQKELEEMEKKHYEIEKKFKDSIEEKQKLQDSIHKFETLINEQQTSRILNETQFNDFKIEKAKLEAEISALDAELKAFGINETELISARIDVLETRLRKHEEELQQMGSVNLRALEVYDKIKAEYDEIDSKAKKLEEEKQGILKIIAEVDKKKKQAFMQAFNAINTSFTENFRNLSNKGEATLELENKQDPFAGGLDIVIKISKGKERNVEALSGGEKVIVALSLIFAIQKYKPYSFYIFDEIDPALDKRNSERLASILKNNIKDSQCLIITHNDAVINQADVLYGISMQEGISKALSLKLEGA
ncbi:MAG: chromosome segregation protein SMC [Candidatus Pacearchaeota archaeon]|nr:chromosome segregation protein SMC [Candidatus Pacearchaeota archaeon]